MPTDLFFIILGIGLGFVTSILLAIVQHNLPADHHEDTQPHTKISLRKLRWPSMQEIIAYTTSIKAPRLWEEMDFIESDSFRSVKYFLIVMTLGIFELFLIFWVFEFVI